MKVFILHIEAAEGLLGNATDCPTGVQASVANQAEYKTLLDFYKTLHF